MPTKPPATTTPPLITITSSTSLQSHFSTLLPNLCLEESEHTWSKIQHSLHHLQAITRGGATKYAQFLPLLKSCSAAINSALLSERTKLSGSAGDLLNSVVPRLGEAFETLINVFVPTLLTICARTNRVMVKRAEKTLHFIVKHSNSPLLITLLYNAVKDKVQGLRIVAAGLLVVLLECSNRDRLGRRVVDLEGCIRCGATDSNGEVRQLSKKLFELYTTMWPERVESFTKPMTPTIRRYLSLPKTGPLIVQLPPPQSPPLPTFPTIPSRTPLPQPPPPQPPSQTIGYNFFPELKKTPSSSSSSISRIPPTTMSAFSVNDATYTKRGLFTDQLSSARTSRTARLPPIPPFQIHPLNTPTPTPSTAPRIHGKSGKSSKSALLQAYKQAFTEPPTTCPDKKTAKPTSVRFVPKPKPEPEDGDKEFGLDQEELVQTDVVRRTKSSSHITPLVESDLSEDDERPTTPIRPILPNQTPRTNVKATRVPAQRIAIPPSSAAKPAMRVAVATPSVKVPPSRVVSIAATNEMETVLKVEKKPPSKPSTTNPPSQPTKTRSSTLTASTASSRNKAIPPRHPKPVAKTRLKSSLTTALTAKNSLMGGKVVARNRAVAVTPAASTTSVQPPRQHETSQTKKEDAIPAETDAKLTPTNKTSPTNPLVVDDNAARNVRTPLSNKDNNLPTPTPTKPKTVEKIIPASSPLRRSTTPKPPSRPPHFSSDFSANVIDNVVPMFAPELKSATVVVANTQLVLGVASSDDASVVEAGGDDETVVLHECSG